MFKYLAVAALAVAAAAPAAAVTYTTATTTYQSIGDQIGSQFDIVTFNGVTGSATQLGTYLINTVDFTAGTNANTNHTDTGSLTNTATADGNPYTYTVPYTIDINASDTITLGGNTFYTNGVKVHFNTLVLTSGGETESGNLTATVSVPEPATWAMMVAGFGLVGVGVRRRRMTTVAA